MNQAPTLLELAPLLPELVLACGAMLMLMIGVVTNIDPEHLDHFGSLDALEEQLRSRDAAARSG